MKYTPIMRVHSEAYANWHASERANSRVVQNSDGKWEVQIPKKVKG